MRSLAVLWSRFRRRNEDTRACARVRGALSTDFYAHMRLLLCVLHVQLRDLIPVVLASSVLYVVQSQNASCETGLQRVRVSP